MEKNAKCDPESLKSSLKKNSKLSSSSRDPSIAPRESATTATTRVHRTRQNPHVEPIVSLSTVDSREERKANGRMIAVCVALFLIFLGIYHAWIRRTAVVAGVIVPVLIMLLYTAWVLYSAKRHKRKMMMLQNATSLNSVNCLDKDSVSCTSVDRVRGMDSTQSSVTNNSLRKQNTTVKFSHLDEIAPLHSRSTKSDPANRKQESNNFRLSSRSLDGSKPLAKVLPRQKSAVLSLNSKDIPQKRRRSLDQHSIQVHFKNGQEKERHGSYEILDSTKHNKKPKAGKEKVSASVQ